MSTRFQNHISISKSIIHSKLGGRFLFVFYKLSLGRFINYNTFKPDCEITNQF